jgi:DNA-binding Lrp family transcriptional regulator
VNVDYKKINQNFIAFILINANLEKLKQENKTQYDLLKEIKKNHFVQEVYIISGKTDLIAKIRAKDVEEFDKYLFTKLQDIEGIKNTESLIVINQGD